MPNRILRIVLLGNYLSDSQKSMLSFEEMLAKGLTERNIPTLSLRPKNCIQQYFPHSSGLKKWAGYIDKYFIFPFQIKSFTIKQPNIADSFIFHICDHSNSLYLKYLTAFPTVITCHDLLAVRGGMGDPIAFCQASATGRILQNWILQSLPLASKVACVSGYTRNDLLKLLPKFPEDRSSIIPNSLNQTFYPAPPAETSSVLERLGLTNKRFFLHVGSSLPRKNRSFLIRLLAHERVPNDFFSVFAGDPLSSQEQEEAHRLSVTNRLISILNPSHETLNCLYTAAHALVFPSWAEGFGWPVIEAQACGCPVITSDRTSLPEVAGSGAVIIDPDNITQGVDALLRLEDQPTRESLIREGFRNLDRFTKEGMLESYESLYRDALSQFSCS